MPRLNASVPDRIKGGVAVANTGCWIWQRHIDRYGYGHIKIGGRDKLAHRASYEAFVSSIPVGMTIDHLCRTPACVNPNHLEPVTNRENILRSNGITAMAARQTHCISGHPLSGGNMRVGPNGGRYCRACDAARSRAYRQRQKGRS